jgi:hypothetical protein
LQSVVNEALLGLDAQPFCTKHGYVGHLAFLAYFYFISLVEGADLFAFHPTVQSQSDPDSAHLPVTYLHGILVPCLPHSSATPAPPAASPPVSRKEWSETQITQVLN